MAIELPGIRVSKVAGGSISQYHFVKLNSSGEVVQCTTDGELPIGVAQLDASAGEAVSVLISGETKIRLGENLQPGMTVGTTSAGRAGEKQWSATGSDSGDWNVGQCTVGGLSGEIGSMIFGVPTFRAA